MSQQLILKMHGKALFVVLSFAGFASLWAIMGFALTGFGSVDTEGTADPTSGAQPAAEPSEFR